MNGSTFGGDRWGLVGVRMIVGALFIVHGWPKLAAGGGGLYLLFGVLVRPAAALLVLEMLVAIIKVNWARRFYWNRGGWKMPALMALLAAVFAITAPGTVRPAPPAEHRTL